jgi:hypothetical protein
MTEAINQEITPEQQKQFIDIIEELRPALRLASHRELEHDDEDSIEEAEWSYSSPGKETLTRYERPFVLGAIMLKVVIEETASSQYPDDENRTAETTEWSAVVADDADSIDDFEIGATKSHTVTRTDEGRGDDPVTDARFKKMNYRKDTEDPKQQKIPTRLHEEIKELVIMNQQGDITAEGLDSKLAELTGSLATWEEITGEKPDVFTQQRFIEIMPLLRAIRAQL